MRSFMKEQIIELFNKISETHKELPRIKGADTKDEILEVLASCQEAAIAIGTKIEESEGEGTDTVKMLEEYCELLYETGRHMDEKEFRTDKSAKYLDKKIINIVNRFKHEVQAVQEILFLPYNASMWSSLDTVWRKADKSSECDAYVVPIPYYTLNPDGTPKDIHYEADGLPDDVTITDYREYNIAERRPDKIYIHNPYDYSNKITSVLPDYYSSSLKRYTDELIYIPYFLCRNDVVPEPFVVLPGTIHAHRVLVQSEKVREGYIKIFKEYLRNEGINRNAFGNPEEKFVAAGSPIIDRLKSLSKEDITIPEEWERYISEKKKENADKKLVFYNTSLQGMFNDSGDYIGKVKSKLEEFKKDESVILWWRPHPLMQAALVAMYPGEYDRYMDIMDRYRKEGWGIYDDTSDVNRAVILTDEYYGDDSSVVEMFRAVGKPVSIQGE